MRPISALTFAGLAALVHGLTVISPQAGDVVSRTQDLVVRWVNDVAIPKPIQISLINNSTDYARQLVTNLDSTLDWYTVSLAEAYDGEGYQIAIFPTDPNTGDETGFSGEFEIIN